MAYGAQLEESKLNLHIHHTETHFMKNFAWMEPNTMTVLMS